MGWGPQRNFRATGWNASWWVVFAQSSLLNASFKLWAFDSISVCWCLQTVAIQPTLVPVWPLSMSELAEWSVWEILRGKAASALLERECWVPLLCVGCSSSAVLLYVKVPVSQTKRCCSAAAELKIREWVGRYSVSAHPKLLLNCAWGQKEWMWTGSSVRCGIAVACSSCSKRLREECC